MKTFKQAVLLVIDGFGVASAHDGNAVTLANPRNINFLVNQFPSITLQASGPSVGLPWGEPGNSEVGHMNIGAGRIVSQDLPRISRAIAGGSFEENQSFLQAIEHVKKNDSSLHLVGMVSSGGVHSLEEHLYALLQIASDKKLEKVYIHMIADGRDAPPKSAIESYDRLSRKIRALGIGKVVTICGRFYAMDRGGHWEVTQKAYELMVQGVGKKQPSPQEAILNYYNQQVSDEMIPPTVVEGVDIEKGLISEGDSVVFFNFRPDRMRQLVKAFADPQFSDFDRTGGFIQNMYYVTMTVYEDSLPVSVAFPPLQIKNGLSEVISQNKFAQFHIAESEKYAHVTSFFNGGRQEPWPNEEREIVTSPRSYEKSYTDVPEMSVNKIADQVISKLQAGTNFILVNFANADMVGHTGDLQASIKAVQAVDKAVGKIYESVIDRGAVLIITADHGNIEEVIEPKSGRVDKSHSVNPVPFIVAGQGLARKNILTRGYLELASMVPEGVLSDVAPTVLELVGLQKPQEMNALSLIPYLFKDVPKKEMAKT